MLEPSSATGRSSSSPSSLQDARNAILAPPSERRGDAKRTSDPAALRELQGKEIAGTDPAI